MKTLLITIASLSLFYLPGAAELSAQKDTIDFTFSSAGAVSPFTATNGTAEYKDGCMAFSFRAGASLASPDLTQSRNSIYAPALEERNTLFFVMKNASTASKMKLCFATEKDSAFNDDKSMTLGIEPNSDFRAYYFNLSGNAFAKGRITRFKLEPVGGTGTIEIDRITFEDEKAAEEFAGEVTSCRSENGQIKISGKIKPEYLAKYSKIVIYETSMRQSDAQTFASQGLAECRIGATFSFDGIPLYTSDITRLSSQFLATLESDDGRKLKVAPRFYIENWRDSETNPYEFRLDDYEADALDFGAKGDGFTDDTEAIQKAVDAVSERGGGRVVLSGDSSFYGRRYVATNIMMKSNVELHISEGAVLLQSQNPEEYAHKPTYGHDVDMHGINWAHSLHVANLPLIQGKEVENVKITGKGKIRMADPWSENQEITWYARYCSDRIHAIPIGFWKVKNIEITDIEIVRSNNYHTKFSACENIFIGNVRLHEVKCVSGDGFGLGNGTHNVKIVRCFFESNDDGIVLSATYKDPRGILWWWPVPDEDNSLRNIEVCHSYINSRCKGEGKAIAFITWGTDNPRQDKTEIHDIKVIDNLLAGGFSVGTWPDNPYHGKQPFDNTETDDYSPVKNILITGNRYLNACNIYPIEGTNIITDCGIHSASAFKNGDFKQGHAYWTMEGGAEVAGGVGKANGGRLYQGLYLAGGAERTLTLHGDAAGTLFVEDAATGKRCLQKEFSAGAAANEYTFSVPATGTYRIGICGNGAAIKSLELR